MIVILVVRHNRGILLFRHDISLNQLRDACWLTCTHTRTRLARILPVHTVARPRSSRDLLAQPLTRIYLAVSVYVVYVYWCSIYIVYAYIHVREADYATMQLRALRARTETQRRGAARPVRVAIISQAVLQAFSRLNRFSSRPFINAGTDGGIAIPRRHEWKFVIIIDVSLLDTCFARGTSCFYTRTLR